MPRAPQHEQRERWVTAISASYGTATIWRYVRDRLVETDQLRNQLDLGVQKLSRTLDEFWLGPRTIAVWQRILDKVNKLYLGWRSILDWLEDRKWRDQTFKAEKEQVIKVLAVLNHLSSIYQEVYAESFNIVLDCFRRHRRVTPRRPTRRRWSTGNEHLYNSWTFENRRYYERMLRLYARRIEGSVKTMQQDTPRLYDSSRLFDKFVTDVQENNRQQEEWWAAWGKRYPWSSCELKDPGEKGSEMWLDHAPLDGVMSWEEDEDLKAMFQ